MARQTRRSFFRVFGAGAAGAGAAVVAGNSHASVPVPKYPKGSIRWAQQQIIAGHRVRQRCWKDGRGCEHPRDVMDLFGPKYEKGIDSTKGLPIFI